MDDDTEIDYEVATDEESLKVRDLERELASVSACEDRKLFIFYWHRIASDNTLRAYPWAHNGVVGSCGYPRFDTWWPGVCIF